MTNIESMNMEQIKNYVAGLEQEVATLKESQVQYNETPSYLDSGMQGGTSMVDSDYVLIPLTYPDLERLLFPSDGSANILGDEVTDSSGSDIVLSDLVSSEGQERLINDVIQGIKDKLATYGSFDRFHTDLTKGDDANSLTALIQEQVVHWYNDNNCMQSVTVEVPVTAMVPVTLTARPYSRPSDYTTEISDKLAYMFRHSLDAKFKDVELDEDNLPEAFDN